MTPIINTPNISSMLNFVELFEAMPGSCIMLQNDAPKYTILASTPEYVATIGITKENLIGKGIFEAFPPNPDDPADTGSEDVRASLEMVRLHKKAHQLPVQRYDVAGEDGFLKERYWRAINKPVFSPDGEVAYIIHTAEDITAEVKAEKMEEAHQELQQAYKKIQESEAKYSTLFNSMDQGFCIIEMIFDEQQRPVDYVFVETNPVMEKQTGLKDIEGKNIKALVPNIESHWFDRYAKVASTGEPVRFTNYSEAMERWFDVYAFKVGDSNSRKIALLFTDITHQKKADEVILRSEQRFRNMVEQAPVAISVSRGEDLVLDVVNERMLTLLNKTKDIIGIPFLEAMPAMKDQPIIDVLRNVLSTGTPFYGNELLVPIPNEGVWEERYFNVVYQPLIEDKKVVGIMNVATEVTEQVQVRKKIEESQQRFYSLANSITQLAWIADEGGWIFWYNDRWYEYTDTTLEEMQGWGWEKVHHPDHRERVVSYVKEAWHKNEPFELIFPLRRHDGIFRWFLTRCVPVLNNEGVVVQWIGTNTDIEDQKQAEVLLEQRVHERTIELEMRNKELEQFAHVSHHDLQEPLRKIIMFTDMVKAEPNQKLSEASLMRLQKVSNAALRMSTALRDVLDFASLNKVEQNVAVDLDEVLADVLSDLELVISEKKATITSDSLPTVKGVSNQMHQLLYNLINNALKFSLVGTPPQIVINCIDLQPTQMGEHTDLDQTKKYHFITVQDNGIGFSQEHAKKIFGMFQRLHSRDTYAGTGIGLALVTKVVLNHGGKIWAESQQGEGATFKVLLPAD